VGLDEVQLLDPPPAERIPLLRELLHNPNEDLVYQAALILAAWGDDVGLEMLEKLVDTRLHERGEFAPNRFGEGDNVYDEIAYAAHLYRLSGKRTEALERVFRKLLGLYGPCFFESKLKYALLKSDLSDLSSDIQAAIERALALGHSYLASQLLPVLARWKPDVAWPLLRTFMDLPAQVPSPVVNVAEALGYIDTPESRSALMRLSRYADEVIAEQARKSLEMLSRRKG
jgi:HEAT repeat protein